MKQLTLNISQDLQPVVKEQLLYLNRAAIAHLERKYRPTEGIHQARLCFKKARAILKLVRPGLQPEDFETFNTFYRQCGQSLGHLRDIASRMETLQKLSRTRKTTASDVLIRQLISTLTKAQRESKATGMQETQIDDTIHRLSSFEKNIMHLSVAGTPPGILAGGIYRLYRQGRRRREQLSLIPDDSEFHQLRKNVKYLGYAFEALQNLYPALMKSQMNEWVKLGRDLGNHHDLVILLELLNDRPPGQSRSNLRRSILRRKKRLENKILTDAALAFLWKPSQFALRVKALAKNKLSGDFSA